MLRQVMTMMAAILFVAGLVAAAPKSTHADKQTAYGSEPASAAGVHVARR